MKKDRKEKINKNITLFNKAIKILESLATLM